MDVVMPKLGLTMAEATLTLWRKAEGDGVKQGDVLFEFDTEKSSLEFECPAGGVLAQILVPEGQTVPCGTPVATLETVSARHEASETRPPAPEDQPLPPAATRADDARDRRSPVATPAAKRCARELEVDLSTVAGRGPRGRIHVADVETAASRLAEEKRLVPDVSQTITPVAKRVASEMGVDSTQVTGSGPGGRVVKEDVLQAASRQLQPALPPASQTIPLSGVRDVIARRMTESAFTAPHVTLFADADVTALVEARTQLNAELASAAPEGQAIKIAYNTLLIAIAARALQRHPRLNACLIDDEIRLYDEVHVALAVDTERGLLVPVVRNADKLDLVSIQRKSDALTQRALAGESLPDDLAGGTFTLTNLGMFEVDGFTPIINQPQAAILGAGHIAPRPAAIDNEIVVRQMMTLSLSFDHRVVDGGPAARFLQQVKRLVERPFALVLPPQETP